MESFNKHPLHLKNPELQTSPEVKNAVIRNERDGEKIKDNPTDRIESYMDRLENVFLNEDESIRKRNLEVYRDKIYDKLIIKKENFPESYFELQKKIARERGEQVDEIPQSVRDQMIEISIADQKASLDSWMNYLTSEDAVYPTWFKYYVWKNITKLSQFDKERGEFKKRTDTTVAPFPDIYREPLAQIADLYEKVKEDNKTLKDEEIKEAFSKKFPSLYAELIQKSMEQSMENREQIEGEWTKYNQGNNSDASKLFESLEGRGTGWCTAGKSTAETQIKQGDFYVYYTKNANGEPTQPRLAIRMNGTNKIGEVRGVLPHQNIEPIMQETLDTKLVEFGSEADSYKKKSNDMKQLTIIDEKVKENKELNKKELIFLYQTENKIESFGYDTDPRIQEILSTRDKNEDALVIFECTKEEIATNISEINENTKAYIGAWTPTIAKQIPENINHLYESFPDNKIFRKTIELSTKKPEQYTKEITDKGMQITDYTKDLLSKVETLKNNENINLVSFSVASLGFPNGATLQEIYNKANELGLDLCPPQVGPEIRLSYTDQPNGDYLVIAMNSIADRDGNPFLFSVSHSDSELYLSHNYGEPDSKYLSYSRFVFSLRK